MSSMDNFPRLKNEQIPFEGLKVILRGGFDIGPCKDGRYQPFIYWTNVTSGCVYRKSMCSEEGQVVYNDTDHTADTTCRCDYTKGYTFVTRPRNSCFCKPTEEDCSCFRYVCKGSSEVLSQGR